MWTKLTLAKSNGAERMELAKMTGMTPPEFTFRRQVSGLAAHKAASHDPLGVLHRDAPLAALDEDDKRDDGDHRHDQQEQSRNRQGSPGLGARLIHQIRDAAGNTHHDAGEDQQAHAVADAAVGNLLTQPHDECRARRQGEHGH